MKNSNESVYSSNNSFVKSQQAKTSSMAGKDPVLPEEAMKFNAYQVIDGKYATNLAGKLTSGLDKTAFPVK